MTEVVLQAQRITKFYGDRPVLHGIDFSARPGQARGNRGTKRGR